MRAVVDVALGLFTAMRVALGALVGALIGLYATTFAISSLPHVVADWLVMHGPDDAPALLFVQLSGAMLFALFGVVLVRPRGARPPGTSIRDAR